MQRRKPNDPVLILLGATLLGAVLLPGLGCSDKSMEVAAAPASPASSAPALVASVPPSDSGFTVSGPLIVEHELDVLAQRDGVIAELQSDAGARVHAGDLLAQLDDRQLTADLEAARAKTHSIEADLKAWEAESKVLQSDYDRAEKMWEAHLITREAIEHAKYKAEADQYDVQRVEQLLINAKQTQRSLELELEKTQIRAPFSGVVARRYVRQQQQVSKGDRLFWVTAEGPLRMRFTVPEKFVGALTVGQQLALTVSDFPGQEHKARVVELSPIVDPASGTFDGMVEVMGAPGSLRPGMNTTLRIDTRP
jgi:membrane fusion protein (multidrug efflux system)